MNGRRLRNAPTRSFKDATPGGRGPPGVGEPLLAVPALLSIAILADPFGTRVAGPAGKSIVTRNARLQMAHA
jgi:hypothetical protein